MNILVIDTGTSSMRGILYEQNARILFTHQVTYQVSFHGQCAEQNPGDYLNALLEILQAVLTYCEQHGLDIHGLSLTCQRSSLIPVDREGTPLLPAVMWMDKRCASICEQLQDSDDFVFSRTGSRINTVFLAGKIAWLAREHPEICEKTWKYLTIADYLTWQITGEYQTDQTYGSRSLLMNLYTRQYDPELCRLFQADPDKLCPLNPPGSIVGKVSPRFSRLSGLQEGLPLISAGGDQQCAAIGHGIISPGAYEITAGTGAYILAYSQKIPSGLRDHIICGVHAVPGAYVLESSILSCASLYNWALQTFYPGCRQPSSYDQINQDTLASPPGANGCIVLPYFQGRGTPDWNAQAKGAFLNLSLQHSRGDMVRAILEAIAGELYNNLQILRTYTGEIHSISIGGGLTGFSVFNQILADTCQLPLHRSHNREQTSLGAFANAAMTLGLYPSLDKVLQAASSHTGFDEILPNPDNFAVYQQHRQIMNQFYQLNVSLLSEAAD